MAPEQFQGRATNARTEVFAFALSSASRYTIEAIEMNSATDPQ
jgi:hypothetical protein